MRVTGITCSRAAVAARVRLGMHSLKHRVPVTTRGPSWGHSCLEPLVRCWSHFVGIYRQN